MITSSQIRGIVGHSRVSEHAITEIIELGSTEEELLEALSRSVRGDIVGAESFRPPNSVVLRLCEILSADEDSFPGETVD